MSTLVEIEQAIDRLPAGELDRLAAWLDDRRVRRATASPTPFEPDFLARTRKIWGEQPTGYTLSELISRSRD
jgi:hypothetical protein